MNLGNAVPAFLVGGRAVSLYLDQPELAAIFQAGLLGISVIDALFAPDLATVLAKKRDIQWVDEIVRR